MTDPRGTEPDEEQDQPQDGPALTTDDEAQRHDTPADPDVEAS